VSWASVLRTMWLPVGVGAVSGVVGWLLGVVPADASMIAVLVAASVAGPRLASHPSAVVWPAAPEPRGAAAWYDIRRLSTVLGQTSGARDVFHAKLRPRLRDLAVARLARYGVSWADPAARRLLGPDVYDLLDKDGGALAGRPPVVLTELVLGRLDELAGAAPARQEGSR
jgi:hypothetical protein